MRIDGSEIGKIGRLYDIRCRHERVRENSLRNRKANLDTNVLMTRCTNRGLKVVQCAQTRVFGTYTIRCSEEMRWPLQRSVQLPLIK